MKFMECKNCMFDVADFSCVTLEDDRVTISLKSGKEFSLSSDRTNIEETYKIVANLIKSVVAESKLEINL